MCTSGYVYGITPKINFKKMKLKIFLYLTIIALILFFVKFVFSQEVIVSYNPHNYTYLVYPSSLTISNKTTDITTLVTASKDNPQPSGRYTMIYNSTSALSGFCDYTSKSGYFKIDNSTTRVLITINAESENIVKSWETSGKIKKISCLYEKIFDDDKKGIKNGKIMIREDYIDYQLNSTNKDWYIVDRSTPIK
jgi:hypothetical protein